MLLRPWNLKGLCNIVCFGRLKGVCLFLIFILERKAKAGLVWLCFPVRVLSLSLSGKCAAVWGGGRGSAWGAPLLHHSCSFGVSAESWFGLLFFFCSWSNNTGIYPTFKSNWEQIPNGLNLGLPLFGAFDVAECVPLGTGALSTAFGCQGDVYCWRSLSAGSVMSGRCYCPVQVVSFVRGWKGIVSPCQFASRSLGD